MSWHHAKPGFKPRHAPHLATAAVAAIVLVALGACTSTSSNSTTGSRSALATASAIPAGHTGALTGAGPHSTRRSSPSPSPGTSSNTRA